MKKSPLGFIPFLVLLALRPLSAQENGLELAIDPLRDGVALGALALGALGSEFLDEAIGDSGYAAPPLDSIPAWERAAMRPYSASLDTLGDIGVAACALLPALPAFLGERGVALSRPLGRAASLPDWLEIGVMYGESVFAAYAAKNLLKSLLPRARPLVYDANAPEALLLDGDSIRSFPSGHATIAFASAAFASTVFILRNPDSPWSIPWTAACGLAASAIALNRVESGSHFWGDALTGAGLGIAAGTITPLLHLRRAGGGGSDTAAAEKGGGALSFRPGPAGFTLSYRY